MRTHLIHCLFILFLVFPAPVFPKSPAIKKDCSLCHNNHGAGAGILLLRPVPELCTECHPDRTGSKEHVLGVVPSSPVPAKLPLDKNGSMTCITCHAPHGEGDYEHMLRMGPTELCISCHKK